MIRKFILAVAILAVAALPVHARGAGHVSGGGHGSHGHHGHHEHHHGHFHHFGALYAYAPFPYYPNCWWEEGHWIDQLYMDKYGNTTTVLQWVPGQWMCWY